MLTSLFAQSPFNGFFSISMTCRTMTSQDGGASLVVFVGGGLRLTFCYMALTTGHTTRVPPKDEGLRS